MLRAREPPGEVLPSPRPCAPPSSREKLCIPTGLPVLGPGTEQNGDSEPVRETALVFW